MKCTCFIVLDLQQLVICAGHYSILIGPTEFKISFPKGNPFSWHFLEEFACNHPFHSGYPQCPCNPPFTGICILPWWKSPVKKVCVSEGFACKPPDAGVTCNSLSKGNAWNPHTRPLSMEAVCKSLQAVFHRRFSKTIMKAFFHWGWHTTLCKAPSFKCSYMQATFSADQDIACNS